VTSGPRASPARFLVDERAVALSGVEERHAALHGCADHSDHRVAILGLAVVVADAMQPRASAETVSPLRLVDAVASLDFS